MTLRHDTLDTGTRSMEGELIIQRENGTLR